MSDCIHDLSGSLDGEFHFGIQGPPGPKGEPFTYEDFTEEQLAALVGPEGPAGPTGPRGADGYTPKNGVDYFTEDERNAFAAEVQKAVEETLKDIREDIADLQYKPIEVVSFGHNHGTKELGETIPYVVLTWELSKAPASLTVAGAVQNRPAISGGYGWQANLAKTTTYSLKATDERGAEATDSTTIQFLNGVYYGALADGATIDSDAILSLNKKVQGSRGVTFTAELGDGARIAYAIPASGYGTPTFVDAVEKYSIDMTKLDDPVSFTNAHGYITDYNVWLSTNVLKGSIKVVVS